MENGLVSPNGALPAVKNMSASGTDSADFRPPYLILAQNASEITGDSKAKLGDIYHSGNAEVIGGLEKPIEVIPFYLRKHVQTFDVSDASKKVFLKDERFNGQVERLPWDDLDPVKKVPIQRVKIYSFYCLLMGGDGVPVELSFRSSSFKTGEKLAGAIWMREQLGAKHYDQIYTIGVRKEKKNTNTYAVFDFLGKRALDPVSQADLLQQASDFCQIVSRKDHENLLPTTPEATSVNTAPSSTVVVGEEDIPF